MLPFDAPPYVSLSGTFTISSLEPYSATAYSGTLAGGVYVEDAKVDMFVRTYDELCKIAYEEQQSIELIEKAIAALE